MCKVEVRKIESSKNSNVLTYNCMQLYLRYNCTMTSTLDTVACQKNSGKWVSIMSGG